VFGAEFLYAGRCPGEQPYYGDWHHGSSYDKSIILVSTSTTYVRGPAYFAMCIEALRGLNRRVVLSVGDGAGLESLLPLPPNFELAQRTSHVRILPFGSLFICLGGIVTQAEALYHGVPLMILTHGFLELEWQADNFARLGLGVHLRQAQMNAETIRERALQILDDATMARSVDEAKRLVRSEPGAEETANRIEQLLPDR
jgi:MGT family glycosyltransferase